MGRTEASPKCTDPLTATQAPVPRLRRDSHRFSEPSELFYAPCLKACCPHSVGWLRRAAEIHSRTSRTGYLPCAARPYAGLCGKQSWSWELQCLRQLLLARFNPSRNLPRLQMSFIPQIQSCFQLNGRDSVQTWSQHCLQWWSSGRVGQFWLLEMC